MGGAVAAGTIIPIIIVVGVVWLCCCRSHGWCCWRSTAVPIIVPTYVPTNPNVSSININNGGGGG
jgi:hypothetical protein